MRTREGDPAALKRPSGPVLSREPRVLKRKHEADRHSHAAVETKRRRTGGRGEDGIRRWVFSPRDLSSLMQRFVIVSYNLLGVDNASKHLDLYHSVPSHCLNWDRRKRQIHKELTLYNPNILCFQEVDKFDELASLFQTDGYAGIYKQRTGEANDGCAIFWKEKEFTLLYQEDIEFQKFGLRNNVAQLCLLKLGRSYLFVGDDVLLDMCHLSNTYVWTKHQVSNNHSNHAVDKNTSSGTECKFARPMSSRTVVVGNIHVLFNPNRGDIKLGQMRVLLERANALSKKYGNAPVVISGDLNSTPKSAICQFLSSTELDILQYDRKKMSGQVEFSTRHVSFAVQNDRLRMLRCMTRQMKYSWSEEEICLASGRRGCNHLRNPLILSSAYQGVPGGYKTRDENGEPLATSYHSKFMGTVDYIWHSSSLVPVGVVDTLPIKILERLGGLPNKQWGSDHLSLVCEFAFVD